MKITTDINDSDFAIVDKFLKDSDPNSSAESWVNSNVLSLVDQIVQKNRKSKLSSYGVTSLGDITQEKSDIITNALDAAGVIPTTK